MNIPAKFSKSGTRERHFYPTREKAEAAAKLLRGSRDDFGTQAIGIAPILAEMATAAAALLQPFGVSILDAARVYAAQLQKDRDSARIEDALAAFLRTKEGSSKVHVSAYGYMSKDLQADFSGSIMTEIPGPELVVHLERITSGNALSICASG